MDTSQINRIRILYILKIFEEHSDDEHPLSTSEIINYLAEDYNIPAHRTTIPKEIDALNEYGACIDVIEGKPNKYYWSNRTFEIPEIKLLIDAVLSSKFITADKSDTLIKKLYTLVSENQAKDLKRNIIIADRIKPDNEKILYWINELHTAINLKQQVELQYFEYDANKEKILKHDGQMYIFSPYTLAWNGDCYYVIGFSQNHNKVVKFRVDRIATLKIINNEAVPMPQDFDMSAFLKKVFTMYDGEEETVELLCRNDMMKCIVDRFGENVPTEIVNSEYFKATAEVYLSPSFYAWIFSFKGNIKITAPMNVLSEYNNMLREALEDRINR